MILKIIICIVFVSYATGRTAKDYREMPAATARLSQAEYPSYNIIAPNGPGTYAFGYEIEDHYTGNVQFRDEEKLRNGTVKGSYGVLLPDNTIHITRYIADQFGYRASSETRKKETNAPLKLELQVQPSIQPRPIPYSAQSQQNGVLINPSTTPIPQPFETLQPQINPAMADAIYQQHHINLNPTYSPLRDQNILDPLIANAILQQQFLSPQNPDNIYGFRQNADGSVSTSQNRPPFFNWFGNNNNNQQQQQQQQGPVLSFFTNLAQNNPLTAFLNQFQPQQQQQQQQQIQQQSDQQQNPFQNFVSNLNPLNLFSNTNNRPQQSQPIQSDYVSQPTFPGSNPILSSNVDQSVFSNDHFLNPSQFVPNSAYGNQALSGQYQSMNYNPALSNPTSLYNQNFNHPVGPTSYQYTTTRRPGYNAQFQAQPYSQFAIHNQAQPYSQLLLQSPIPNSSPYQFHNPYQAISPIAVSLNPNYQQKKKSGNKTTKKKNDKNKVDLPENDSDWFQDFLDKRKSASLDVSSRQSTKKSSEEDDDMFDEYFR